MRASNFKDLVVWQKARELVKLVYLELDKYPQFEKYSLIDQIRRSVISIPSNIAEGQARNTSKEFVQFLGIARGSCAELETQLILSCDLGFLEQKKLDELCYLIKWIDIMLTSLIMSLKKNRTS